MSRDIQRIDVYFGRQLNDSPFVSGHSFPVSFLDPSLKLL